MIQVIPNYLLPHCLVLFILVTILGILVQEPQETSQEMEGGLIHYDKMKKMNLCIWVKFMVLVQLGYLYQVGEVKYIPNVLYVPSLTKILIYVIQVNDANYTFISAPHKCILKDKYPNKKTNAKCYKEGNLYHLGTPIFTIEKVNISIEHIQFNYFVLIIIY
jgi:hypothetical protein